MINLFGDLLTRIFSPVLALPFSLSIFIITAFLMTITSLIYYFLIDKHEFRRIRERIQELQKKSKELQKENPKKAEEVMKEILQLTHKQMMINMKPMFATLFVVIIFLPWISSISFVHLNLNESLKGVFRTELFTSVPKEYEVQVKDNTLVIFLNDKKMELSEGTTFELENNFYRVNKIDVESKTVELGLIVKPPFPIPFFSYGFGWLMWYIVCSSLLLYTFRRVLGI